MKHAARIVALLVLTFLVTRPLLAYACAGPCEMAVSGHRCCAHAEPMVQMPGMTGMAGCGMQQAMVLAQACCDRETASVVQDPAKMQVFAALDGKKLHASMISSEAVVAQGNASHVSPRTEQLSGLTRERFVLFQVFRI